MPRFRVAVLLIIAGGILAGCGGNAQPLIITEQPTPTLAATLPPTTAPTPIALRVTATAVPTIRPMTATPGPSPTSPLRPTLPPPPQTQTATRAPTLSGLSILYFTTDSEFVSPGDNVTLFWGVRGTDRARIFRVDDTGERVYRWDVPAEGKITVATRPGDREVARFLLVIETGDSTAEQPLLIPLQCPDTWFFDPAPDACPAETPQISNEVEQTFERGRMIWVESLDRIYVIFEDGETPGWAQYPDNFQEGDPERDDTLIPPPDLLQPVRGFGLIWRTNPRVNERLGWATTPEVAFEGMYQADSIEPSVATLYLRMRDGGILALDAEAGDWDVILPSDETSS